MSHKKDSRKKLKRNYISMKNQIRKSSAVYGGLFESDIQINGNNQWVDFYFIGFKERIVWNAEIITAKLAYQDIIDDIASSELNEILGNDSTNDYPLFSKENDEKGMRVFNPIEPSKISKLGNLTWNNWTNNKAVELADSGKIFVYESAKIDFSYRHGRGLHIIKNVEGISIEIINDFIRAFLKDGEKPYTVKNALSFRSDEIAWKRGYSNALRCSFLL